MRFLYLPASVQSQPWRAPLPSHSANHQSTLSHTLSCLPVHSIYPHCHPSISLSHSFTYPSISIWTSLLSPYANPTRLSPPSNTCHPSTHSSIQPFVPYPHPLTDPSIAPGSSYGVPGPVSGVVGTQTRMSFSPVVKAQTAQILS